MGRGASAEAGGPRAGLAAAWRRWGPVGPGGPVRPDRGGALGRADRRSRRLRAPGRPAPASARGAGRDQSFGRRRPERERRRRPRARRRSCPSSSRSTRATRPAAGPGRPAAARRRPGPSGSATRPRPRTPTRPSIPCSSPATRTGRPRSGRPSWLTTARGWPRASPCAPQAFPGGGATAQADIASCLLGESTARLDAVQGITPPEAVLKATDNTDPRALSWYTTPEGSRIAMVDTQGDGTGGAIIAWVIIGGADGFVVNPTQFYFSDGSFTDHGVVEPPDPSFHRVLPGTEYQFAIDYSHLSPTPARPRAPEATTTCRASRSPSGSSQPSRSAAPPARVPRPGAPGRVPARTGPPGSRTWASRMTSLGCG